MFSGLAGKIYLTSDSDSIELTLGLFKDQILET